MIPVFIIGALAALAIAASSKAKTTLPTIRIAPKPATKTTTVRKVTVPTAARRKKVIKAIKPAAEKKLSTALEKVSVTPSTKKAQDILRRLATMAASKQTTPAVRAKAAKAIKAIAAAPTAAARKAVVAKLPTVAKQEIRKAVAKAETVKPTPDQAAQMLKAWTDDGGNQGTKNNRSAMVKKCQELMGFTGSDADGIIGPKTRARAKEFGYVLAPRSRQKPGAVGYLGVNLRRVS